MKHLIIDGEAPGGLLEDRELIYRLLDTLPSVIGMTKIMPPWVFPYMDKEDQGVTGIVLIAESTIIIHTFVERGTFNLDVFSCKDFDTTKTVKYIVDTLLAECEEVKEIWRK